MDGEGIAEVPRSGRHYLHSDGTICAGVRELGSIGLAYGPSDYHLSSTACFKNYLFYACEKD